MNEILDYIQQHPAAGRVRQWRTDGRSPEGHSIVRTEFTIFDHRTFLPGFVAFIGKPLKWNSLWKRVKRAGFNQEDASRGRPSAETSADSRTFFAEEPEPSLSYTVKQDTVLGPSIRIPAADELLEEPENDWHRDGGQSRSKKLKRDHGAAAPMSPRRQARLDVLAEFVAHHEDEVAYNCAEWPGGRFSEMVDGPSLSLVSPRMMQVGSSWTRTLPPSGQGLGASIDTIGLERRSNADVVVPVQGVLQRARPVWLLDGASGGPAVLRSASEGSGVNVPPKEELALFIASLTDMLLPHF